MISIVLDVCTTMWTFFTEHGPTLAALAAFAVPALLSTYYLYERYHINGTCRKSIKTQTLDPYIRPKKIIHLINSADEWEKVWITIQKEIKQTRVIGFDCEWTSAAAQQHHSQKEEVDVAEIEGIDGRVSLLQLATHNEICILLRLLYMEEFPASLLDLLSNKNILKLGVSPKDDANRLERDHGLEVRGCIDLRAFTLRCHDFENLEKLGLKSLTESVLGITLDKNPKIRLSNWETVELSHVQKEYAAHDALVAMDIFRDVALRKARGYCCNDTSVLDPDFWSKAISMCQGLTDATFKARSPKNSSVSPSSRAFSPKTLPRKTKAYVMRTKPLYENCHLLAPDGEILSTCNVSKATWYLNKGLGDIVSKEGEQLKVRLHFEPAGRPLEDGVYYAQEKDNNCVVCGSEDDFNLRKNIIPQEYRKHFPTYMKDHSSHDVLLMCLPCHQLANLKDHDMRLHLANLCNAPIGTMTDIRCFNDADLRKVKSFGKALLHSHGSIPDKRQNEMRCYLADYYGLKSYQVDDALLKKASEMETKTPNKDFKPHGAKVIEWMNLKYDAELIEFEKMWRQNFLDKMRPKYLPNMWSVDHNHKNVRSRVERGDTKFLKGRLEINKSKTGDSCSETHAPIRGRVKTAKALSKMF